MECNFVYSALTSRALAPRFLRPRAVHRTARVVLVATGGDGGAHARDRLHVVIDAGHMYAPPAHNYKPGPAFTLTVPPARTPTACVLHADGLRPPWQSRMRRWPPSTSASSSHRASSWSAVRHRMFASCRTATTRDGSTSTCARRARWISRGDQLCTTGTATGTACLRVSPRACRTHSRRGRSTRGHGRSRRARRGRGRRAPKAVPRCGSPRPASGCGRADRRPRRGRHS